MANEFKEPHRITYYETDTDGYVTPAMLLNMAILVSEDQNDALQLSRPFISSFNVAWIVVQYSIQIKRMPKMNEQVTLSTKGSAYNKIFALREFWIRDQNNNECAYIKSTWITMNLKARKLVPIPSEIVEPYHSKAVKVLPHMPRPMRIKEDDGQVMHRRYRVRYTDIDFNHHVNNSKYLDWMMDMLSYDFLTTHEPTQIDIKFENEVLYGSEVTSNLQILQHGEKTKHEITDGHTTSAVANVKWQQR